MEIDVRFLFLWEYIYEEEHTELFTNSRNKIFLKTLQQNFSTSVDEELLLQAAEPVLAAYEEHYDIKDTKVFDVVKTPNNSGGSYIEYYVEVSAQLKYDNATELPQIRGLSKSLNIESQNFTTQEFTKLLYSTDVMNEIVEDIDVTQIMSNIDIAAFESFTAPTAKTTATTLNGTVDEKKLVANAVASIVTNDIASFVEDIEDTYIGTTSSFNLGFRVELDANGNIVNIGYAILDGYTDDMSVVTPRSAEDMMADGVQQFNGYINSAVDSVSKISATSMTPMATSPFTYSRLDARDYANTYTSNAKSRTCTNTSCENYNKTIRQDTSKYNSDYEWYCCNDCANYVSQAMFAGGVPTDSEWDAGEYAWTSCSSMKKYFVDTKEWWSASDFAKCSAGGVAMLFGNTGSPYHVVMIVQNDTVTRTYSGHTNDRLKLAYSSSASFGADSVEYYDFDKVSPAQ